MEESLEYKYTHIIVDHINVRKNVFQLYRIQLFSYYVNYEKLIYVCKPKNISINIIYAFTFILTLRLICIK